MSKDKKTVEELISLADPSVAQLSYAKQTRTQNNSMRLPALLDTEQEAS